MFLEVEHNQERQSPGRNQSPRKGAAQASEVGSHELHHGQSECKAGRYGCADERKATDTSTYLLEMAEQSMEAIGSSPTRSVLYKAHARV